MGAGGLKPGLESLGGGGRIGEVLGVSDALTAIKVPSKATLKKYGLDSLGWLKILEEQGWVCAICKKRPPSGRMVTDHFHRRKWKKLPAEKRRAYVRGITCWTCNHYYLGRGITERKAMNVVLYLRAFSARVEEARPPIEERVADALLAWEASRDK